MSEHLRQQLRTLVRGMYDLQKLRIQTSNRIVASFKVKLGQLPGKSEEELDKDAKAVLAILRASWAKLSDAVGTGIRKSAWDGDGVIDTETELALANQFFHLQSLEKDTHGRLRRVLGEFPIFVEFLKDVKGVGPSMAGVIVSEFDITKAQYPSSLWKYAGLDVGPDGRGRSRREAHLIDVEYKDKKGETQTKKSITFNPFLKTKLVGVLGPSFLKSKSPYSEHYYNYRNRLEHHVDHKEKSKLHKHNMAVRFMIKRFLVDLYSAWRALEGLPVSPEYSIGKLGMKHGKAEFEPPTGFELPASFDNETDFDAEVA